MQGCCIRIKSPEDAKCISAFLNELTGKGSAELLYQDQVSPEDAKCISAMAASLFPEACGVADILEGQILLLKPLMPVHGTQRLLTGCNQVLVIALAWCNQTTACQNHESVKRVYFSAQQDEHITTSSTTLNLALMGVFVACLEQPSCNVYKACHVLLEKCEVSSL